MTDSVHLPALGTHVRLGRLAPSAEKLACLPKFGDYVTDALPAAPKSVQYGVKVPTFPMYGNDTLGDCTCAAVGHQIQMWTSQAGEIWTPTTQEVENLYWNTGDGQDDGRVETDVLDHWKNIGFGQRADKIAGYVRVDTSNLTEVKQATWLFGGLYLGIDLPITAQQQKVWSYVANDPNNAPGSWGGHAVPVSAYSSTYFVVITWGMRMKMMNNFWKHYVEEAYAILSHDWINSASSKAVNGFNFDQLQADLKAF